MAEKLDLYPHKREKIELNHSTGLSGFATTARTKVEVQPSGKDNSYFCDSAFLAERGCLSQERAARHPAAAHHRI
jgi:hypothetical protein